MLINPMKTQFITFEKLPYNPCHSTATPDRVTVDELLKVFGYVNKQTVDNIDRKIEEMHKDN